METYVKSVNENTQDGAFLRSVVAIRQLRHQDALAYIEKVEWGHLHWVDAMGNCR
jgi:hypothetical protein